MEGTKTGRATKCRVILVNGHRRKSEGTSSSSSNADVKLRSDSYTVAQSGPTTTPVCIRSGVEKALIQIWKQQALFYDEGAFVAKFGFGLLNVIVTAYIFGRYLEYYPIWYIFQSIMIVGVTYYINRYRRTPMEHWCMVDLCWVYAMIIPTYVLLCLFVPVNSMNSFVAALSDIIRSPSCLYALFGLSLGPMATTIIMMNNAMVFHKIQFMGPLFIHLSPAMLCYTLLQVERLNETWPVGIFPQFPMERSYTDLIWYGNSAYGAWFLASSVWLLIWGIHYPKKYNMETVFSYLYKILDMPNRYKRWFGITTLRQCAAMYLAMHFAVSTFLILCSTVFFHYEFAHGWFLILLTCFSAFHGSKYYINGPKEE